MFNKDKSGGRGKSNKEGSKFGGNRSRTNDGNERGRNEEGKSKRPRLTSSSDDGGNFERKSFKKPEYGTKPKADRSYGKGADEGKYDKRGTTAKFEARDSDRGEFKKRSASRYDSDSKSSYGKREDAGFDRKKSGFSKSSDAYSKGNDRPDRSSSFEKKSFKDSDRGEFKKGASSRSDTGFKSESRDSDRGEFKKRSSARSDNEGKSSYAKRGDAGFDKKKPGFSKSANRFSKDTERPARTYRDRGGDDDGYVDINEGFKRSTHDDKKPYKTKSTAAKSDGLIRLNKYLADAGIASRRKADELIAAGEVTVNGTIIIELGFKVSREDKVSFNGQPLRKERTVYVLLNKPKDYITTTEDPQERRTVMELVKSASRERIYPVGRLDRNTTGLLLMTNDGELAQKLAHPKHEVTKLYHVTLDKTLRKADFEQILAGLELEDGPVQVDDLAYVEGATKKEVGIEIHSGKNRIVRRIFESLGYEVVKLDRSIYAGLTKKDLPRGRWRYLTDEEIKRLKHFSKL